MRFVSFFMLNIYSPRVLIASDVRAYISILVYLKIWWGGSWIEDGTRNLWIQITCFCMATMHKLFFSSHLSLFHCQAMHACWAYIPTYHILSFKHKDLLEMNVGFVSLSIMLSLSLSKFLSILFSVGISPSALSTNWAEVSSVAADQVQNMESIIRITIQNKKKITRVTKYNLYQCVCNV